MAFKKRKNPFDKITFKINDKIDEVNEKINDKFDDMSEQLYETNDKITDNIYSYLKIKKNKKDVSFCELCNKESHFLSEIEDIKICRSCARKLKISKWIDAEFESDDEIKNAKKEVLSVAVDLNVSDKIIKAITTYFEKQLDGELHMLNGNKGQVIKVYEDHCEIITKYVSDEAKDQYFKMNGMSSLDINSILSNVDTGDVLLGLMGGGGIIKSGTKIAKNVALKTAMDATKGKVQKRTKTFPVKKGKQIIRYDDYDIVKLKQSDSDEFGYLLIQNSRYLDDPDEDVLFMFYADRKRNEKVSLILNEIRQKMSLSHKTINKESHNVNDKLVAANSSVADEILKFKNLLDMGAITEEEFNEKKKQLLNL